MSNEPGTISPEKEEPMPIIVKGATAFTPAPEGVHSAVCCDVLDLGWVETIYQNKTQKRHKVEIRWQISEVMDGGKPYLVRRRYSASLHEKSSLRRDLESWRGRAFTDVELQSFDLENLLSAPCLINLVHRQQDGSVFANVVSITRLPKGMTPLMPHDYTRVCDRPPSQADAAEDALGITDDDVPF
jgi:hypothetical protein